MQFITFRRHRALPSSRMKKEILGLLNKRALRLFRTRPRHPDTAGRVSQQTGWHFFSYVPREDIF